MPGNAGGSIFTEGISQRMKYHILHLGCQMNQSDAERVRTVVKRMGYQPAESEEDADLLGIVACSVRQKAIDKAYSRISGIGYYLFIASGFYFNVCEVGTIS
jgi:hypothetical protein